MGVQGIKFRLNETSLKYISKNTKLTPEELCTLSITESRQEMIKRGAIKAPNMLEIYAKNLYNKLGERLGFIEKPFNIYTDID